MDLKKISKVDLELGEDQRPTENSIAVIEKTAADEKLSLEYETSRQLLQEQQQQPQEEPAANRKCFNEHLNEVSAAAINENIVSDEMQLKHQTFPLNDSRPEIDVETGLDTMNDDCLSEICQYLNLFDIVHLGQTCMHLESFAQRVIFPKKAKLIEVKYDGLSKYFTMKFDHMYLTKSLTVLTNAIKYLGRFIEDFKLQHRIYTCGNSEMWQCIVNVLQNCKHLKTLTMSCVTFDSKQVQEFQELIGSLTSLKVLNLLCCEGMISNWSANIKHNLTIEKLSIQGGYKIEINDNFLAYFKNVSSLELWGYDKGCDLSRILNHFGHSLKRLRLDCYDGYRSVATIISENLTNLEHLEVALWNHTNFIDLPHLKSVQLIYSTNTLLRKLSVHGMIETLQLSYGIYTLSSEGTNESPLIFNKLQTLKYESSADLAIFIAMANAQLPALHTVKIKASSGVVLPELLKHVQSKMTIKSIHLELTKLVILPFEFWSQLVDILREPCVPNREFLHLRISSEPVIEKEAWKLLKDNRHLLKVEHERKCLELIIN